MTGQVGWRESSLWIGIHGDMLTNLKTNHNNTSQKTFKARVRRPPPSLFLSTPSLVKENLVQKWIEGGGWGED